MRSPSIPRSMISGWAILCLLAASASLAPAEFMEVDKDVPVEKVLPQLEQRVKADPKDAQAHYLLGRIHSLAWASGGDQVRLVMADDGKGVPSFAPYASVQVARRKEGAPSAEALKHLQQSVECYQKAVELDPKNGLYHLGLAWMMEQRLASAIEKEGKVDRVAGLKAVIDTYVKAFDLRLEHDIKSEDRLIAGDAFVAAEAAENAVRLLKTTDKPDEALIKRLQDGRSKIFEKPMAITPVIVALQDRMTLADLVNEKAAVRFDLSGLNSGHRWPWVTEKAGVLVWDPQSTGRITSGRQLFGNMTWQMLFRDGYEALSTLDADHDGQLTGRELDGIAMWRDVNGDAISDAGEVVSAAKAGIRSIQVRASKDVAGVLHHTSGVTWTDGRQTASYDWVPKSK